MNNKDLLVIFENGCEIEIWKKDMEVNIWEHKRSFFYRLGRAFTILTSYDPPIVKFNLSEENKNRLKEFLNE